VSDVGMCLSLKEITYLEKCSAVPIHHYIIIYGNVGWLILIL